MGRSAKQKALVCITVKVTAGATQQMKIGTTVFSQKVRSKSLITAQIRRTTKKAAHKVGNRATFVNDLEMVKVERGNVIVKDNNGNGRTIKFVLLR